LLGCLCAQLYVLTRSYKVTVTEAKIAFLVVCTAIFLCLLICFLNYVLPTILLDIPETDMREAPLWLRLSIVPASCFRFAPFIAVIIFCCARDNNKIPSSLPSPLIVQYGEASYSLYLLHMMVIYAFRFSVSPIITPAVGVGNALMWGLTMLSAIGLSLV